MSTICHGLPNMRHHQKFGLALVQALFAMVVFFACSSISAQSERGLLLSNEAYQNTGHHWGARLGVVISEKSLLTKHLVVDAHPEAISKVQSAHILSDYNLGDGYRATLGLLKGPSNYPWWDGSTLVKPNGSGLSLQKMYVQNALSLPIDLDIYKQPTVPYIGAGYHGRIGEATGINAWRFQADLGLIALNSSNAAKLGRVLSGDQGFEELIRELRLRPVVKFSINYKF